MGGVASSQNLPSLSDYHLIVTGYLFTTSKVEGRTIVGGSITSGNGSNFRVKLQGKAPKTNRVLRVGGNSNPINLDIGSLDSRDSLLGNPKVDYF